MPSRRPIRASRTSCAPDKVRIGLHLPQFVKDKKTGEIRGSGTGTVIVPIAQALADRMGVKLELVGHPAPPVLIDCLKAGDCDIGFLGFTEARTKDVDYATPHIMVPFTYLVPANSSIRSIADADKPGVRIAVVRNHASTHALEHVMKHATMIDVDNSGRSIRAGAFRQGGCLCVAAPADPGIRQAIARLARAGRTLWREHPGDRVQQGPGRAARLCQRVRRGRRRHRALIQKAITAAGERGIVVSPQDARF